MRVLVVNAHGPKPDAQKSFQDLLACVKESLKVYNGVLELTDECVVRNKDNLEDFLYDEHTSFSHPNAAKQFDGLDFIIVAGDLHSLPWHPSNFKVLTLLRMCLRVKKCLFAIGFAMQALVYLSASNLNHAIHVINGNGKGGKLGDMGRMNLSQKKINSHDYFLDSVTGDIYYLQQESNEWAPLCNIGMHHSRTAQEYNTLGKFVIKTPIYRPKKNIHNSENADIYDENVETKCFIKKMYLSHWLFHNAGMEFIVPYKGRWEIHNFNFTNKEMAFDVLAESEQGPLVIEYPRIVGVKFLVSKRYKETFQIFSNFFTRYADKIRCNHKPQNFSILAHASIAKNQPIAIKFHNTRHYKSESTPGTQRTDLGSPNSLRQRNMQNGMTDDNDSKVFKHSGMATKMKGKIIVDSNSIGQGRVHNEYSPQARFDDSKAKFLSNDTLSKKYSIPKKVHPVEDFSFVDNSHKDMFAKNSASRSILKSSMSRRKHHASQETFQYEIPYETLRGQMEDESTITKADVRRWLYPELKETESAFDQKNWIPGNLSKRKIEHMLDSKPIRVGTSIGYQRKKGSVPQLNTTDLQKSLRATDPYTTYSELAREHQRKEDEKIIGSRKFVLAKGNVCNVSVSPSSRFTLTNLSRQKEWY